MPAHGLALSGGFEGAAAHIEISGGNLEVLALVEVTFSVDSADGSAS